MKLTNFPGVVGVNNAISDKTLNAWYLLTEAIDSDLPESSKVILTALLGTSLVPILISEATFPSPQIWANIQRDLQQQFLHLRREVLDTLLYIQRSLTLLGSPNLLLELIFNDLQHLQANFNENSKSHIESRLRALMIVAEEEDSSNEESAWTPVWQKLASLVFTSPELTKDAVNAKLAIALIGSLLPLMKGTSAADEAVKMLLSHLQSNPLVRDECLGALHQAADSEVPLLSDPQIIASLLRLLAGWAPEVRSKLLRLLSRLISDLSDETQRWEAFNALIQSCLSSQDSSELAQVLKTPFTFRNEELLKGPSPYRSCLAHLMRTPSIPSGEALLSAWIALSGCGAFALFQTDNVDPWNFVDLFLKRTAEDFSFFVLGAKLLAAWVYGMSDATPEECLKLLELTTSKYILATQMDPHEEGLEAVLDSWIHFIKHQQGLITECSHVFQLYNWILQRISIGQLSVPLLRSFARFLCSLVEFNLLSQPQSVFPILQMIFAVGISGKIGRSGMEILSRVAYDISLKEPDFFRSALNQLFVAEADFSTVNLNDRRLFLRNLGAAHTSKKFKSVLIEFCLQSRGLN